MQDRFEELKNNLLPRFWDTENNEMIYPEYDLIDNVICYNAKNKNGIIINFALDKLIINPRFIPMKPTGLKDKNGQLIYEGDVIVGHNFDDKKTYFVVKYSDYSHKYIGINKNECYDVSPTIFHKYSVIGNIYANPELL